ncbi:MAG: HlyC/CorC family transporter [Candidatus Omnitrophica bacterium]|nr:HlyC/CorC family transporter [Candidatus Omnitrophota bacterium]
MDAIFPIIFIILSLAMQAFFAGSEMSIISSNKIRLSHRTLQGDSRARLLESLLENPENLLGTTLLGVNIAVIVGSSMAASLVSRFYHNPDLAAAISTVIMLPLVLIFGQVLPMAFARRNSTSVSLSVAFPIRVAYIILFPLVFIAANAANLFSKLFGHKKAKKSHFVTREELKLLIKEGMRKGVPDDVIMDMAYEIFDFGSTDAEDIMIPLKNVVSASKDKTVEELINIIIQSGYSWIPIYSEWPDNIIGVVKATDLLVQGKEKPALDVMRPCYLLKEDELLEDALKKMQQDGINFAIVSDMTGRLTGIITLEDIVEEIVGEIEDEYAPKHGK